MLLASSFGHTAFDMDPAGEVFVFGLILAEIAGASHPVPAADNIAFVSAFLHGNWSSWIVVSIKQLQLYMYTLHAS